MPLVSALSYANPLVRSHAAWALGRVGSIASIAALAESLSAETDQGVIEELRVALAAASSEWAHDSRIAAKTSVDDADAMIVGAGLSGLAAAAELIDAGRRVILVEQEPENSVGGQAFWSFGGLFLVDSPEQSRLLVRTSRELAWQDWLDSAGFDRADDDWARKWAESLRRFRGGRRARLAVCAGAAFSPW